MCGDESLLNGDSVVALNWLLVLTASIENPGGPSTSQPPPTRTKRGGKNQNAEPPSSVFINLLIISFSLDIFIHY